MNCYCGNEPELKFSRDYWDELVSLHYWCPKCGLRGSPSKTEVGAKENWVLEKHYIKVRSRDGKIEKSEKVPVDKDAWLKMISKVQDNG